MTIKIAITGNVASGKSEVLKNLRSRGYPCFDSDIIVHKLYQNHEIQKQILDICKIKDQRFNKNTIFQTIYTNKDIKHKLESFIHPMVESALDQFIVEHDNIRTTMIFMEVPLLFEVKWENKCDYVICLYCQKEIRTQRAASRGISNDKFNKIDKSQLPENIKKDLSDFTIDTDEQIEFILEKLNHILTIIV
jgi:dephospho-CoA kinase